MIFSQVLLQVACQKFLKNKGELYMEDIDYFEKEEFSPFKSIMGLVTFSTILPFKIYTSIEHMTRVIWIWPIIHFCIGLLGAFIGLICLDIFHFNIFLVSVIIYSFLLLITGFHHSDGLMDMADGVMVHGNSEKKLKVMKDHMVGAGGICAFFIIALLSIGGIYNNLTYDFITGIVIAEMVSKTSLLTTCLTSEALPSGIGSYFVKSVNIPIYLISTTIVTILAYLFGGVVGIFGVLGAIFGGSLIAIIGRNNFKVANGDVLGASNEVGRVFALFFMVIALFYLM